MSIYDAFFRNISPENWEFFAVDFLYSIGFRVLINPSRGPDGGKDFLVEHSDVKYVVSCKHYIVSGKAVGVSDEESIIDRVKQHGAEGFIEFCSTLISSGLQERLKAIKLNHGCPHIIYDIHTISNHLPYISAFVLQKYGLPNGIRYVLNVDQDDYYPLPCLKCGSDILVEQMIPFSLAMITTHEGNLHYLYGCKMCFGDWDCHGWVEVSQALHQEQLNGWIRFVKDFSNSSVLSEDFYKHKNDFEAAIQQRMFPSNWGKWGV